MKHLHKRQGHKLVLFNLGLLCAFLILATYCLDGRIASSITIKHTLLLALVTGMLLSSMRYRNRWWQLSTALLGMSVFLWFIS
jgi:hypothetical protein